MHTLHTSILSVHSQKLNYVALFGSTSAYWEACLRLRPPSTLCASLFVLWWREGSTKKVQKHIMGHMPVAFLREVRTPWWTILTSPRRTILTTHASFDTIRSAKFLKNALPILENTTAMLTAALAIPVNILRHLLWGAMGARTPGTPALNRNWPSMNRRFSGRFSRSNAVVSFAAKTAGIAYD